MAKRHPVADVQSQIEWLTYNPKTIYTTAGDYRVWVYEYDGDEWPGLHKGGDWEVIVYEGKTSIKIFDQHYKTKQEAMEAAELAYWRCVLDAW